MVRALSHYYKTRYGVQTRDCITAKLNYRALLRDNALKIFKKKFCEYFKVRFHIILDKIL